MGEFTRRHAMRAAGATALSAALAPALSAAQDDKAIKKGRIKQAAALWCWRKKVPLKQLIKVAKRFGMPGIDVLNEKEWGHEVFV